MSRIMAVLGPTNTGKTYLALERMMGHASGMMGFPLRLLARENYERVVKAKGASAVALVTGEERVLPPRARYFICTVESMPTDRQVDFLAVDEIQLAADPERGHIFTDRLLQARGLSETMFLGAAGMKGAIQSLVPRVQFESRPRFSKLEHIGPRKLLRLPRRSAVVAFSAAEVYGMADLIRRQKGGAAVVLGALSPRTRNAQVGLYQSGEVDYLVATDAIGMGLNMNVDHVAFAALRKFDGRGPRPLAASELAQIAGRAGRHMSDGTFGVTADCPELPVETVAAIENHAFPPIKTLMWRNVDLRFLSVETLLADLERAPNHAGLMRARDADDHLALLHLAKAPGVMEKAMGVDRVRLLWEVAQIPDFRKLGVDEHARLLEQIYLHLAGHRGHIDEDWLDKQIKRLDRADGEIDHLSARIAHIRTWTYVSHRADWVRDPAAWQERARDVEDRLSDALHERLTQRFVDRRTSALVRRMKDAQDLPSEMDEDGLLRVEGHAVGRLQGFSFTSAESDNAISAKTLAQAADRILSAELSKRAGELADGKDEDLRLDERGRLLWRGFAVAALGRGADVLSPALRLIADDSLKGPPRQALQSRLTDWLERHLRKTLASLYALQAHDLKGPARGLAFQLQEELGLIEAKAVDQLVAALDLDSRRRLDRLGVRFGRRLIYLPAVLKPDARRAKAALWSVWRDRPCNLPPDQAVSLAVAPEDEAAFAALGFPTFDGWCLRADKLEDLLREIEKLGALSTDGAFALPKELCPKTGLKPEALGKILAGLGHRPLPDGRFMTKKAQAGWARSVGGKSKKAADSPFAILAGRFR